MVSKRQYEKKLKELENLTDLKFELRYDENEEDGKYKCTIVYDDEVWFHGRDCYADLDMVTELCCKTRAKAFKDFS